MPPPTLKTAPHPTITDVGPITGRGIKGIFSRAKVISPEPADPTIRSRLRSFTTDNRAHPSRQPDLKASSSRSTATSTDATGKRHVTGGRQGLAARPGSPNQTRRNIRFGPSLLPAIQKGTDGKWQPPSLSRGSMSTSALAMYAQSEDEEKKPQLAGKDGREKGTKHALAVLFTTKNGKEDEDRDRTVKTPVKVPLSKSNTPQSHVQAEAAAGSGFSWQEISPPASSTIKRPRPSSSPTNEHIARASPQRSIRPAPQPMRHKEDELATVRPSRASVDSSSRSMPTTPARQAFVKPSSISVPASPTTRTSKSTSQLKPIEPLSTDHYHLRLATSYIIRVLTPFVRGSGFDQNEKLVEIKRHADEHIATLARMEKGWGGDWLRATGTVDVSKDLQAVSTSTTSEQKVRAVHVSERVKDKERKVWGDVMRDGILLCLLLNQLFPSNPQHITRVNITGDGILRATNLTRFQTACQTVGLDQTDIFGLSHLQEGDEEGMGKVAWTVIVLAKLSPRSHATSRARSPDKITSTSPPHSRASSRMRSPVSPSGSPQARNRSTHTEMRPRAASPRPDQAGPSSPIAVPAAMERTRNVEMTNDLHTKLAIDLVAARQEEDPAYRTPTTSVIMPKEEKPESPKRAPLARSTTQPKFSPSIRPKSPVVYGSPSPSRSATPIGKPLTAGGRPTLRPRYTTGSKIQVSFADGSPPPWPNSAARAQSGVSHEVYSLHSRERTPSLISSGSRVTSGYTRSSAAFSVSTIVGEDHSHDIDIVGQEPDSSIALRMRERRMSGKTLQNARQKILGTLLSSDDLPRDLRSAFEDDSPPLEDLRGAAINQSLAALEGWSANSTRPVTVDISPRRPPSRPISRCGDVSRVAEEDEVSSNGGSLLEGRKPSIIRRTSANGKVYVPKRSTSPARRISPTSPQGMPFPSSSNLRSVTGTGSAQLLARPISRVERRQSDGLSYAGSNVIEEGRPMNLRNNSMVNLGSSSAIFRESMLRASQSQPLQILEFNEAGMPPVKYQIGNCVGKGQFGAVYRSLNLSSGQMVAIKRIKLEGIKTEEIDDVMHEVDLMKKLSHPSIVRYEGMSRDDEYLNIVLEYIENGSLVQTLKSFGRFNEQLCSSYVAKILEGLDYLHSQGVVHCDLKAANILSTKNGNVKLSDFGVSLTMKAVENLQQEAGSRKIGEGQRKSMESIQGSPNWMAPEVINLQGARTASDIWSLGCTIVELLTGQPPYSSLPNSMAVLWHIVMDSEPPIPDDISDELRDFLQLCFIKDPEARPAAVVLFEHPWIKKLNPDLALRPQDSVPFLRRVSMDLRRIDSTRLFSSDTGRAPSSQAPSTADAVSDVAWKRHSYASSHQKEGSDGPIKEHALVKTTFGKAILCRICHASVKKGGVLCHQCGLICHSACVTNAPLRCDATQQVALLARQQEYLAAHQQLHVRSAASSRRQSFNDDHPEVGTGFTALPTKLLHGLKRNKSGLRSNTDLAETARRRRSSSNLARSTAVDVRPSLDVGQGESTANSRNSVFTDESLTFSEGGQDMRRGSAIRFEFTEEVDRLKDKANSGVELVRPEGNTLKGHKAKDSKSDCIIA